MSLYYKDYLALDQILNAQHPRSATPDNAPAHEEMLFIVIHQSYELWFKQIKYEVDSVLSIMNKEVVNDNSSELSTIVHRLKRVGIILKMLVAKIDVLETMSPMDFLGFRDYVRPASGFQSWQFKEIEAALGLKYEHRYGQEFYTAALKKEELDIIKKAEASRSLLQDVNGWLERMPFINDETYWNGYTPVSGNTEAPRFWNDYQHLFLSSLPEYDSSMEKFFRQVFNNDPADPERQLSATACRSALFIILYREYPLLELPFQLLDTLLEIDNQLGNWRYRHINMVKRMIGARSGTGGSSGMDYLKAAAGKHYIFREIAQLNSFLTDRRKLPSLPAALEEKLRYKT